LFWALFASVVAIWAVELGSLIEVVNRFGSFFYGSILGVFLLAIGWSRCNATGAFVGLIAGMFVVALVTINTSIAFLWHNLIGAVVVFVVGMIVSEVTGARKANG
jgi:SSS family solute:Na+ symporter